MGPREKVKATLAECLPVSDGDPVALYLRRRCPGIAPTIFPDIRYHPSLRHPVARTNHPAMVAVVRGADGKGMTLHKTYLTPDGRKAFVEPVRLLEKGLSPAGGAVRLLPIVGGRLGVAEGIETALAASILHCYPVWACLSAGGIASFIPPGEVTDLAVFPDNDDSGVSQIAAVRLGARTGAYIQMPPEVGMDWADVLLEGVEV